MFQPAKTFRCMNLSDSTMDNLCIYPTSTSRSERDTWPIFSGIHQVSIQTFHSSRFVALPRLENPVGPTSY